MAGPELEFSQSNPGLKDQNMTMHINDYDDARHFIGAQKKTYLILMLLLLYGLYKGPLVYISYLFHFHRIMEA